MITKALKLNIAASLAIMLVSASPIGAPFGFAQDSAPAHTYAYGNIQALMDKDDFKAAIKLIKKTQERGDGSFTLNQMLVEAYYNRIDQVGMLKKKSIAGKMKHAMEHSIALKPNNIEALESLTKFHILAPKIAGGDKDAAAELIKKIALIDPLQGHILAAELASSQKDPDAAMIELDKALALEPGNADTLLAKGRIQSSNGNYSEAILTFETCQKNHPQNMDCLYQIGKSAQIGDIERDKGIAAFQTYIEHAPDTQKNAQDNLKQTAYAHYRLGNLYLQSGDPIAAKKHYEDAVRIDDLKNAKKALNALK